MKSRYPLLAALLFSAVSALYAFAPAQTVNDHGAPGNIASSSTTTDQAKAATVDQDTLGRGTILVAEFEGGLNAKKLKPGDTVKAILTQDLVAHGKVVAPVDSKLIGHVTEARPQTEEDRQSRLGVVFDKLLLKHHQELKFLATVQILAPPAPRRSRVDQPDQMLPPSMMGGGRGSSPGAGGRGGTGGGTRSAGATSNPGGSIAGDLTISAPMVVGGTPGNTPGDKSVPANLPQPLSANNKPVSAGQNVRPGIYGIKDLLLGPADSQTPGPVILSNQSTVKLEDGTQVVLQVTGPGSAMANK